PVVAPGRGPRPGLAARPRSPSGPDGLLADASRGVPAAEQALQVLEGHGLGEVHVEAGGARAVAILVLAVAGDRHEEGAGQLRVLAQQARDGAAVEARRGGGA